MRRVRFPAVSLVAMTFVLGALVSSSEAVVCNDDGKTYTTACPLTGGEGQLCINPDGILNGCCNKGTCNGSGSCITGDVPEVTCDDGNACTDDMCTQNMGTHQTVCNNNAPNPAPTPARSCNNDGNVCTIEVCEGTTCTSTGTVNTCAAEQAASPAGQPICKPWTCDPTDGCAKRAVPNSPPVTCDDGKDCTTGDHCVNGTCAKGDGGSIVTGNYPCRDDDTNLADGDQRTWCRKGTCSGNESCSNVTNVPNGGACDPNGCTDAHCVGAGASGTCIVDSCNVGQTVFCAPCGTNISCVNYQVGQNANVPNACGCLSLF